MTRGFADVGSGDGVLPPDVSSLCLMCQSIRQPGTGRSSSGAGLGGSCRPLRPLHEHEAPMPPCPVHGPRMARELPLVIRYVTPILPTVADWRCELGHELGSVGPGTTGVDGTSGLSRGSCQDPAPGSGRRPYVVRIPPGTRPYLNATGGRLGIARDIGLASAASIVDVTPVWGLNPPEAGVCILNGPTRSGRMGSTKPNHVADADPDGSRTTRKEQLRSLCGRATVARLRNVSVLRSPDSGLPLGRPGTGGGRRWSRRRLRGKSVQAPASVGRRARHKGAGAAEC